MKTAIEKIKEAYPKWCFYTEQGEKVIHADVIESLINEGLEMEKKNIVDAYVEGCCSVTGMPSATSTDEQDAIDYFTQTFTKR